MAYRGGGADAGRGGNFGSENFGGNRGNGGDGSNRNSSILSNVIKFFAGGGFVGAAVKGVTGAIKKAKTNKSLQGTSDYQGSRSKSSVNSFGGEGGDGSNSNVVVPLIKNSLSTTTGIAPTAAEVSQSKAAEAYDLRKTKAKGRSMTILTKSTGLKDDKLTLGKKSLLGR